MNVTRMANRAWVLGQKYSPQILLGAGLVGFGATVVLASKETLSAGVIFSDHGDYAAHHADLLAGESITKKEYALANTKLYANTAGRVFRLYAPSIIVGTLSVAAVVGSHGILQRRSAALAAAYTALDTAYSRYRSSVREEFGEEKDREIFARAAQETTPPISYEDAPEGEEGSVFDPLSKTSQYAKWFDKNSGLWQNDHESNLTFLRFKQQFCNDLLVSRGHLFLNDVYDELDIPRTKAGAVTGWVYNNEDTIGGDDFVDLGIYSEENVDSVNGYDNRFLLDPNVQGVIYDLLGN